ncbi:MAG TPA: CopD family protein [Verrucomicrobiae bacterium]|jgi:putative copper resistance protein D
MTTGYLILARAVHFGACLLFFGIFAFDRFVAASVFENGKSEAAHYWKSCLRFFSLILLPVMFVSGAAWFVLVAMAMSGQPPRLETLQTVWLQTQFGTVWQIRMAVWAVAMAAVILIQSTKSGNPFPDKFIWFQFLCGGLLLGSLAWAGHGREDSRWHLTADVLHLLGAGVWPAGLLPFAMVLRRLRSTSETTIGPFVRRFSSLSLGTVLLMAATGLVNTWFLAGSFSNLVGQSYGRWLLLKIALFCIATAIGAINLLRLRPRLSVEDPRSPAAQAAGARLQTNVQAELLLGAAVVMIVAVLGVLPP